MDNRGSLLYLSQRKKGHRRQPTVSEGPSEPGIAQEYQFGFHRKNMSHKYWPFINGFFNLIVSGTTMAAFYIYPHMAKLFPVSNSVQHGKKFCPSGIIAIDFSSTCHLDKSNDQTTFLESIRTRLLLVVSEFNVLCSKCIDFAEDRIWVANNALQHILWWGVCLPTTCCYQYILGCRQISRSTNFSCALALGLLTKFATIGCISSLQVYSLIAPLCQYILSMAGHTLANALKWSCSHGVGHDSMCTLCVINLLDNWQSCPQYGNNHWRQRCDWNCIPLILRWV